MIGIYGTMQVARESVHYLKISHSPIWQFSFSAYYSHSFARNYNILLKFQIYIYVVNYLTVTSHTHLNCITDSYTQIDYELVKQYSCIMLLNANFNTNPLTVACCIKVYMSIFISEWVHKSSKCLGGAILPFTILYCYI